jgi:5'-nucleotidase/UDP-sugar diphosphatase
LKFSRFILLFSFFIPIFANASVPQAGVDKRFHIHFTNDWQSRIADIARLQTLLLTEEKRVPPEEPVLRLDAGDFTMGSLFHTISREIGAELQLMKLLRYDAVCLGNHEFDFYLPGLVQMIRSAQREVGALPPILATNLVFSHTKEDEGLRKLMDEGVLRREVVIERNGIRFGLMGIMGKQAGEVSPNSRPVHFSDPIQAATEYAQKLRTEYHVDYVIVLSHSGVFFSNGSWSGEDVDLAAKVPGIDVILGGHSHTVLYQPILVKHVPILQAGAEMHYLGKFVASKAPHHRHLHVEKHELFPIDTNTPGDPFIAGKVTHYKKEIDRLFLSQTPYRYDQPILKIHHNYTRTVNDPVLGFWVTDSMRKRVKADIGFTGTGTIRDDWQIHNNGIETVADLFQTVPLGVGVLDQKPGYPLVRMYFTGKELKQILEILLFAYQTKKTMDYYPRFSGIHFLYNPYRIPLDRIFRIEVQGKEIDPFDTQQLYSLATTSYVGGFLWLVDELSFGLFHVQPKDEKGKPILEIREAIVNKNPSSAQIEEIKEWETFLEYMTGLGDKTLEGYTILEASEEAKRIPMVEQKSFDPRTLFKNATWIQWSVAGCGLLVLLLLLGLFRWLLRRIYR